MAQSNRPAVNPVDAAFTAAYAARQADLTWGTTPPPYILTAGACSAGGQCTSGTSGPWIGRCTKCGNPC